jgi:hypothetical protein
VQTAANRGELALTTALTTLFSIAAASLSLALVDHGHARSSRSSAFWQSADRVVKREHQTEDSYCDETWFDMDTS